MAPLRSVCYRRYVNIESTILSSAAKLLAESPTGDVSTRAVCEAAGITQPVLYRLFGDKDGLLSATVDFVWDQYLAMKRAATPSEDPLLDLERGWDSHVTFARAHPHAYRLLFGTALSAPPEAGPEAMRLLLANLDRLAQQGRLRLPPTDAAKLVMAANSGIALALILRPDEYSNTALSGMMRDLIYRSLLVEGESRAAGSMNTAAITLQAGLAGQLAGNYTRGERSLFDEWLDRISAEPPAPNTHSN